MDERLLRAKARENLAGKWPLAIAVAAVAVILGNLGAYFLPEFSHSFTIPLDGELELIEGLRISFKDGIFGLAAFILGGVLDLGYSHFMLKLHDGQKAEFKDLFSQFNRFGNGFVQMFLRKLYILLWGLLFIIPGIIAGYSYSMTPYIMLEHPELTPSQAIRASKEMMNGHKGEYFVMSLGFFGWILLAVLTTNLGFLALNPYVKATEAAFYRSLSAQNTTQM